MFRATLLLLLVPAFAAAQPAGEYRFVHLYRSADGAARVLGGTIAFDAQGGYRASTGDGAIAGRWRWNAAANAAVVSNPAEPSLEMSVRVNEPALLGSTADAGVHDLFVAARATSPAALRGEYGAAYFRIGGGAATTAFLDLTADGQGRFTASRLVGHAADLDDVNRVEQTGGSTYTADAARFAGPSDALTGERTLAVAAGGSIAFAYGSGDVLIAVRKEPDAGIFSFRGLHWIAEMGAEGDFVYRPEALRFYSSSGALRAAEGTVYLSERVKAGGRVTHLSTVNTYRIWAAGDFLGPRLVSGLHNFALGESGVFVGAQVGREGELTLEHGIFVGMQAQAPAAETRVALAHFGAVHPAAPLVPGAVVAPGAAFTLYGSNLARSTVAAPAPLPTSLAGVRVLMNGLPADLYLVSPEQVNVRAPDGLTGATAAIEVDNNGEGSNRIEIPAATTAPGVYVVSHADYSLVTGASPARPGETVIVFAGGLGTAADPELRVLFNAVAGEIHYAGPVPGFAGLYQINVTVPEVAAAAAVNLAIATSNAVADLAEIVVR